ncbi:hypothetical protein RHGRI_001069 [Rhododendron griersonianum]|uniref:Uncharacterized protein n=1 Tax=Rhododendron griersonianum TaxID=479676 RepID=A0AAV6LJ72_9ERIC|nr:hypothetical protein RHGRI_001069 [Rhododendron griersonianum]
MRFSCEMSGKYRPFVKKVDGKEVAVKKRVRSTGTKKCECPFELKAVKGNDGWTVFIHNDTHQCLTFLPLRYLPLPPESRCLIALGHVNGDHFVMVHL